MAIEARSARPESRESSPRLAVVPSPKSPKLIATTATAATAVVEEPQPQAEPVLERSGKREVPRPKIEPPEVVTVEMTAEEQEVYAHMGISPLIFIGKEVKDLRNTVVSVVLPGEAPKNLPPIPISEVEESIAKEFPAEIDRDLLDNLPDTEIEELPTIATLSIPDLSDLEESKVEQMEEPVHKSPEASRRRRRTSTAS
ncbi:MAG: hypothetical protein HC767_04640 [Akkermansiaceae bacterium]|nr:hypothetical protein [Akkermansiaceae bacterium]